jgi:hypothetical protein
MSERFFVARLFLIAGAALAVLSLVLWLTRPIAMFPPYLVTALLALGYGAACRWGRFGAEKTPAASPKKS